MLDEVISIMIYNRKLKHLHKHFLYSTGIHYYHFKMQDLKSGTMHVYYQYIFIPSLTLIPNQILFRWLLG